MFLSLVMYFVLHVADWMPQPNLIDVLKESDTVRSAFGLPSLTAIAAGGDDTAVSESLGVLNFAPRAVYLAVKRQSEDLRSHEDAVSC